MENVNNVKLDAKEALNYIISELLKRPEDPKIQLGEYLLTGEPIYLPDSIRKISNRIDTIELMEYVADLLINQYRSQNK